MSEESHQKEEEYQKKCGELVGERMRYFTGRYLTARDFRDEQDYHLTHRYLHNRVMHGWGVVCGLHVWEHPNPGCRRDRVKVNAGMAVDCCGREIVVEHALVPPPIPWADRPADAPPRAQQQQEQQQHQEAEGRAVYEEEDRRFYPLLCLRYVETPVERVPVLYSEGNCDEQRREYSRISEGYEFHWEWVRRSELPEYHWRTLGGGCNDAPHRGHQGHGHDEHEPRRTYESTSEPEPGQQQAMVAEVGGIGLEYVQEGGREREREREHEHDERHRPHPYPCPDDDCYSHPDDRPPVGCLEPSCPPHHCVPLALVETRPGAPILADDIVMLGRPTLRPPTQSLTHICSINWPHGGVVPRRHLERLRRLEVRFDRRLKPPRGEPSDCGPYGVNPCTFVVQFGGGYEDLDFVTYEEPPRVEHDCVAVYTLDPRSREQRHHLPFSYLENQTVFITIKCDFILDCHGVPVDGNHLGGLLPSGDGVRGGTFESWFRVVPDHAWDNYERDGRRRDEEQGQ